MDQKEAHTRSYNNKKTHQIYMKKKLIGYLMKGKYEETDPRTILKNFSQDKPHRSNSCGYVPRNKIDVGNSLKTLGCAYCFLSLNNKLQKRQNQKMDFKEAIKFVKK